MFRFAGFELDPQRFELRGPHDEATKLRPQNFAMLMLFAANAGRVLSKQQLMQAVWPDVHVSDDSLFKCIRELRTALGDDRRQLIKLVSGHGYMFDAEVTREPAVGAVPAEAEPAEPVAPAAAEAALAETRWSRFVRRGPIAFATVGAIGAIVGLAVAAPIYRPNFIFTRPPPIIAVMPISGADGQAAVIAARVTDRLIDGMAGIDNLRVVAPQSGALSAKLPPAPAAAPDFVLTAELRKDEHAWALQARLTRSATHEVAWTASISVNVNDVDEQLQQSRLVAGLGHPLAVRINELLEQGSRPAATRGKVAVEQAIASISQTSKERFAAAQTMLQKEIAADPDNVDPAVALAALQMRGIQMVWYSPDDARAAEAQAGATLERALRTKPNSIAVLETYCRFLSATNRFVESLVTCTKVLSFDPWNGAALYLVGLGQLHLGRFEDALATFRQADRFDTPQVSRWTWLLGAGWANVMMGRGDDASPWLQRSIAITPASGRSHMLMAAAYQQLGRIDEARAAVTEGLKLRPGTTALNVAPPTKNASPVFVEASERVILLMIMAGLPES